MNFKKELKKLDIYDLKFICNEVGVKYNKKSSKQIIIKKLLKPINKKYTYTMNSADGAYSADGAKQKFWLTDIKV